jgi:hypothetical protein
VNLHRVEPSLTPSAYQPNVLIARGKSAGAVTIASGAGFAKATTADIQWKVIETFIVERTGC